MTENYYHQNIPRSRIATMDVYSVGKLKHHVSALLEFDVTGIRKKLRESRREGVNISFNAWLIKVISQVLQRHPEAVGYIRNKRKMMLFRNIRISMVVEKRIHGRNVPIPLVIEQPGKKSPEEITREIEEASKEESDNRSVVLNRRSSLAERFYYYLPGWIRRAVWKLMLRYPKLAYRKMGNVAITSVGMMGRINGWFIHSSVHPVSFGIGSILRKPVAVGDEIRIREVLHMTVLVDHDVIDGAPMVRMLNDLTREIEGRGSVI